MSKKMFMVVAKTSPAQAVTDLDKNVRQAWVATESLDKLTSLGLQGEIIALPYPVDERYVDFQIPQQAKELGEFLAG